MLIFFQGYTWKRCLSEPTVQRHVTKMRMALKTVVGSRKTQNSTKIIYSGDFEESEIIDSLLKVLSTHFVFM